MENQPRRFGDYLPSMPEVSRRQKWILYVLGSSGTFILLAMGYWMHSQLQYQERHRSENIVTSVQSALKDAVRIPYQSVLDMRAFILSLESFPEFDLFDRYAASIMAHNPMVHGFAIVDEKAIIRHFYPYEGNKKALGLDLNTRPAAPYVLRAITERRVTISNPTLTVQGVNAVVIRAPLFKNNNFLGLVQAVVDVTQVLNSAVEGFGSDINLVFTDSMGNHFWGERTAPSDAHEFKVPAGKHNHWKVKFWIDEPWYLSTIVIEMLFWTVGFALLVSVLFIVSRSFSEKTRLLMAVENKTKELRVNHRLLQDVESRWRSLLEQVRLVAIGIDKNGRVYYANPYFLEISGFKQEEVIGRDWMETFIPKRFIKALSHLFDSMKKGNITRCFENPILTKGGNERLINWFNACIVGRDGGFDGTLSLGEDITAEREAQQYLDKLAYHDILTGLPNRALLNDRLHQAKSRCRREENLMAVLMLDLDHFKDVNDSLGHGVGDKVLIEVAGRLQSVLREMDTVARIGGDEFTIVLESLHCTESAEAVADKILKVMEKPFDIDQNKLHLSVSIGIVIFPFGDEKTLNLLQAVDTALYYAKSQGRNTYRYYEKEMAVRVKEQLELINSLHSALEKNEFTLAYQPIVSIAAGGIVAHEALIRWQHPRRGMLSPPSFIPLAENSGLIIPIGYWVLREAIQTFVKLYDGSPGERLISVNLSAGQFKDTEFVSRVQQILSEENLPPQNLVLEITESQLMENNTLSMQVLSDLKKLGCNIAIDDFGTGYSSLSYLRLYPVDILKIDRSFMIEAEKGGKTVELLKSIHFMSINLDIDVVVEGLENEDQVALLRSLQFNWAQGFYFGRPVAADQLLPHAETAQ